LTLISIPWVFFDLGNTLISEEDAVHDRIRQIADAFAALGITCSEDMITAAFLQASSEFAPRLSTRAVDILAGSRNVREAIFQKVTYRKELERPYPDALAVLQEVSKLYHIGIIANQSGGTEARLLSYGMAPFISLCLSSTEEGMEKPNPAIFRLALRRANCSPEQAVMVGDRIDNDIEPAKALGWKTIWVLQGFAEVQRPRSNHEIADVTVGTLSDVLPVLHRLCPREKAK
jgi:HAD superfamily hydrolase (TIGR01662 family)